MTTVPDESLVVPKGHPSKCKGELRCICNTHHDMRAWNLLCGNLKTDGLVPRCAPLSDRGTPCRIADISRRRVYTFVDASPLGITDLKGKLQVVETCCRL